MVNYFKQQWEIGRHKEIKDQMNGMRDVMEDVLEDNSMTGQFMTANVVEAILNIRSINQEKKQKEVRNVIRDEKLQVCAIIETHVKAANMSDVYSKVFGRWEWVSNSIANLMNILLVVLILQLICKSLMTVNNIEVEDCCSTSFFFTWMKSSSNPSTSVLKKLDRIMVNEAFVDKYPHAYSIFLPYLVSNHCPDVLSIPEKIKKINSPFRFMNYVADKPEFLPIIQQQWSTPVDGFDVFQKVANMKEKLKISQTKVDANPHDSIIEVEETKILLEYKEAISDENKILSQKAKIDWLRDGVRNSAYFHEVIKGGRMANKIISVCDENGNLVEGELVVAQFVRHIQDFLSQSQAVELIIDIDDLFSTKLTKEDNDLMIKEVTDAEIKEALFDIGDNKSPGPDGYSMVFLKKAWSIVGQEVCLAIKEFFNSGKLLTQLNATLLTLVPKDNILLSQELLKGYDRKVGPKRCSLKIDIAKAYDTVDWDFLVNILHQFGYHEKMVNWIKTCVTTTSFFINVNGDLMVILKVEGDKNSLFKYNFGCKDMQITHLCFADDLFVLCNGDIGSIKVIKQTLQEFSKASILVPSLHKSIVFFGSVPLDSQQLILAELLFSVGTFPVRYLGVPLITKRISLNNCKQLVDKVRCKVQDWKNKDLSYAGFSWWLLCFLWCGGELQKGKAKVSWKSVCHPKNQGGLGLKMIGEWNEVLLSKHIWNIVSGKESLWIKWVQRIIHKFGNGKQVTMRYDNWSVIGPLDQYISMRDIYDARLADYATVAEMTSNGRWKWPEEWLLKFPMLQQVGVPLLQHDVKDHTMWSSNDGSLRKFSTKQVWQDCIVQFPNVPWSSVDRILSWNPDAELKCPLSKKCPDSHNHLFFQCDYSMKVWSTMKRKAKMLILPGDWDGIVNTMRVTEMTPDRLVRSTVGLIPTNELALEGHRIDPSVPSDTVAMFVATDIADQLLELRPSIVTTYSMIAPDSLNFLTTATQAASRGTTDSRSIRSRSHVKLIFSSNVIL
ncbi:RNA-directed DNA polymerase, eukaryota, reverse transcriptase zinc-binding domain protein [Tanacetum coccineum]